MSNMLPQRKTVPASQPNARPASKQAPSPAALRFRHLPHMVGLLMVCSTLCVLGLLYLGAYARLSHEGFRRTELLHQLHQQSALSEQYTQILARLEASPAISQEAHRMHMAIPAPGDSVHLGGMAQ